MPLWQTERDFSADEFAVAAARHFCISRLTRLLSDGSTGSPVIGPPLAGLVGDAELVVSELISQEVTG